MGTRDYARILRRSWALIVVMAVLGVLVAWAVSATSKPVYSATSVAFVASDTRGTLTELTQGNDFTERRVSTYANLVTEPLVTDPVIKDFALNVSPSEFAGKVSVSIPVDTTLLEVTVSDTSPSIAASVANALISNLAVVVADIETTAVTSGAVGADGAAPTAAPPVKITQVRFAEAPTSPVTPNVPLNLVIGLFAGLALGTLAAILRDVIDTRVRSLEDVEAVASAPIVGTIPQVAKVRSGSILTDADPGTPTAESFRILRTNLQFLDIDGPATFVVTSPGSGEGKSTVTVNLAASIAANGSRVLVVEADLRRPRAHEYLGLEGGAGLTDILIGRAAFSDVVQTGSQPNLHLLASGRVPPNPSELLGSQHMLQLMNELQGQYDVVLYDTPPVLPVPDAAILSRSVGGVLMVVSLNNTRRDHIRAAISSFRKVNARVAGIIANRVAARGATGYLTESYSSVDPGGDQTPADFFGLEEEIVMAPHPTRIPPRPPAPDARRGAVGVDGDLPGGTVSEPEVRPAAKNSPSRSRRSKGEIGRDTLP